MATVSGDTDVRWRVSFAADLMTRTLTFHDGVLVLRRDALRLVLLDSRGATVDARFLREAEAIDIGDVVALPCHFAKVRDRLPAVSQIPAWSYVASRGGAIHGDRARRHAVGATRCETGPRSTNHPPMADARHVGRDPILHSPPQIHNTGTNPPPLARCLT